MKKILISKVNNQLIAWVGETTPKLLTEDNSFITEDKNNILAAFDVSECYIHC